MPTIEEKYCMLMLGTPIAPIMRDVLAVMDIKAYVDPGDSVIFIDVDPVNVETFQKLRDSLESVYL